MIWSIHNNVKHLKVWVTPFDINLYSKILRALDYMYVYYGAIFTDALKERGIEFESSAKKVKEKKKKQYRKVTLDQPG